jgi:thiol-disulfide isomerase/thioredoxin
MAARTSALAAAVLTAALLATGCGGPTNGAGPAATPAAAGAPADGAALRFAPAERKPAPATSGDLLGGGRYALADRRGEVVVVNFWASWCAPCRAEAADLEKVFQATRGDRVSFLGVNSRDQRDAAVAFAEGRMTYPSIYDPAGRVALTFRDVPPTTFPSTLVVDRQGRIAAVFRKVMYQQDLEPVVREIAAEPS